MSARNEDVHAPREAQADSNEGEPGAFSLSGAGDEKRGGGKVSRTLASARRRGRLTLGFALIILFYTVAVFADFLAPEEYRAQSRREPSAPPSVIRFRDARGSATLRPHVYARRLVDPLQRRYVVEHERAYPLALFTRGHSYKLFGLLPTDIHLFGVSPDVPGAAATNPKTDASLSNGASGATSRSVPRLHLLGTDALGRDRFSRLLVASRFSLVVGPLGTLLACALGVFLGCLAGYMGRTADALLMRVADTMMALPALVLILAARAAFPLELPPVRAAVLMVTIFALVGWAEMARLARGLVLSLRRREFVQATVMLPAFLLAETSLSFLGVGLQEPEPSWGNMLAEASDINLLQRGHALTMLAPALAIFLFVLGVRLLGDGLRNDKR